MAAITLSGVSRSFSRGVAVLTDVTFGVPDGGFWAIVGPAGAGKSALLRLIAGVDRVADGSITVEGGARGRSVALLAGAGDLNPRRHAYANIAAGLKAERVARAETEARTLAVADALELGPLLARKTRLLSVGERQAVAFARTLVRRPGAFLLDEPFGDAGGALRDRLRAALGRLQRAERITTVLATQNSADAMRLADTVVALSGGRIAQIGAPAALYDRPASVAAARALSAWGLNVLPVRANQTGLSLEDGTTLGGASVMTRATYAYLAVRAEHLFVPRDDGPPPALRMPTVVEAVETTGAEVVLRGRVGPHAVSARLAWAPDDVAPGATLVLGAERARLHMFDAETEQRL